jgi:hypothetical protein
MPRLLGSVALSQWLSEAELNTKQRHSSSKLQSRVRSEVKCSVGWLVSRRQSQTSNLLSADATEGGSERAVWVCRSGVKSASVCSKRCELSFHHHGDLTLILLPTLCSSLLVSSIIQPCSCLFVMCRRGVECALVSRLADLYETNLVSLP